MHALIILAIFALLLNAGLMLFIYRHELRHGNQERRKVDPWALQAELMFISGQEQPTRPILTDNSLLYAALNLEEQAETLTGMAKQLDRGFDSLDTTMRGLAVDLLATLLVDQAKQMGTASMAIREVLKRKPGISIAYDDDLAIEVFDGTTDVAVVNCGFAIASGFPGAAGYLEVVESNLSKANPATGMIDKTQDGKWIKGSDYREPNLGAVLHGCGLLSEKAAPFCDEAATI